MNGLLPQRPAALAPLQGYAPLVRPSSPAFAAAMRECEEHTNPYGV